MVTVTVAVHELGNAVVAGIEASIVVTRDKVTGDPLIPERALNGGIGPPVGANAVTVTSLGTVTKTVELDRGTLGAGVFSSRLTVETMIGERLVEEIPEEADSLRSTSTVVRTGGDGFGTTTVTGTDTSTTGTLGEL